MLHPDTFEDIIARLKWLHDQAETMYRSAHPRSVAYETVVNELGSAREHVQEAKVTLGREISMNMLRAAIAQDEG